MRRSRREAAPATRPRPQWDSAARGAGGRRRDERARGRPADHETSHPPRAAARRPDVPAKPAPSALCRPVSLLCARRWLRCGARPPCLIDARGARQVRRVEHQQRTVQHEVLNPMELWSVTMRPPRPAGRRVGLFDKADAPRFRARRAGGASRCRRCSGHRHPASGRSLTMTAKPAAASVRSLLARQMQRRGL